MSAIQSLKRRIESITKTASITKAMHRIAASKLNSTQNMLESYQYFKTELEKVLLDVSHHIKDQQFLEAKPTNKRLFILITSDRGLAGSYHQQLFNAFLEQTKHLNQEDIIILVIGKKGFFWAKKNNYQLINQEAISNRDQLSVVSYANHANYVEELFIQSKIKDITLVYNHFINALKQEVKFETLLPVNISENLMNQTDALEFMYEGAPDKIFEDLIAIYLQSRIYGVMVDAKLSEFAARIVAMKQATDNSNEVLRKLNLQYHQARQQKITADLLDIVNGKV